MKYWVLESGVFPWGAASQRHLAGPRHLRYAAAVARLFRCWESLERRVGCDQFYVLCSKYSKFRFGFNLTLLTHKCSIYNREVFLRFCDKVCGDGQVLNSSCPPNSAESGVFFLFEIFYQIWRRRTSADFLLPKFSGHSSALVPSGLTIFAWLKATGRFTPSTKPLGGQSRARTQSLKIYLNFVRGTHNLWPMATFFINRAFAQFPSFAIICKVLCYVKLYQPSVCSIYFVCFDWENSMTFHCICKSFD